MCIRRSAGGCGFMGWIKRFFNMFIQILSRIFVAAAAILLVTSDAFAERDPAGVRVSISKKTVAPERELLLAYNYRSSDLTGMEGVGIERTQKRAIRDIFSNYQIRPRAGNRVRFRPLDRLMTQAMKIQNLSEAEMHHNRLAALSAKDTLLGAQQLPAYRIPPGLSRMVVVQFATKREVVRSLRRLNRTRESDGSVIVAASGPNEILSSLGEETVIRSAAADSWNVNMLQAPAIWSDTVNGTQGRPTTIIAVIDSGVDYSHTDLTENIWLNRNEIPHNRIDDDSNGYVDDVIGWDFVSSPGTECRDTDCSTPDNNPMDENGHGTFVAGIAAASRNGSAVTGICPRCIIMPLRAGYTAAGGGTAFKLSDVLEALYYAMYAGADIINCSWGTYTDNPMLRKAIEDVIGFGSVVVAAAGNSNSSLPAYPAAYPKVISVAATNQSGLKADFSNFGPWVTTAAPGVEIISTATEGRYTKASGTSMAAPHVSGFVGLMLSSPAYSRLSRTRHDLDVLISVLSTTGRPVNIPQGPRFMPSQITYNAFISRYLSPTPPPPATHTPAAGVPTATPRPPLVPSSTPTPRATATATPTPRPTFAPPSTPTPTPTPTRPPVLDPNLTFRYLAVECFGAVYGGVTLNYAHTLTEILKIPAGGYSLVIDVSGDKGSSATVGANTPRVTIGEIFSHALKTGWGTPQPGECFVFSGQWYDTSSSPVGAPEVHSGYCCSP